MLLFERCGSDKAYAELITAINESDDGKAAFLAPLEEGAVKDPSALKLEGEWNNTFVREWLTLDPPLSDVDLRGIVYVSRERLPVISAADRLSSEGAGLLEALVKLASPSPALGEKVKALPAHELSLISERILARARNVEQWGTHPDLHAMNLLTGTPGEHGGSIQRFIKNIPPSNLTAAIIPMLADKAWGEDVLRIWAAAPETPDPVKRAITSASKKKGVA